jgi:hypothetical protein
MQDRPPPFREELDATLEACALTEALAFEQVAISRLESIETVARTREMIERSRVLMAEVDVILGRTWGSHPARTT